MTKSNRENYMPTAYPEKETEEYMNVINELTDEIKRLDKELASVRTQYNYLTIEHNKTISRAEKAEKERNVMREINKSMANKLTRIVIECGAFQTKELYAIKNIAMEQLSEEIIDKKTER